MDVQAYIDPSQDTLNRLEWTLQALNRSQQTFVRTVIHLFDELSHGPAKAALNRYVSSAQARLDRLHHVAASMEIDLYADEPFSSPEDITSLRVESAMGSDVSTLVLTTVHQMAIVQHGLANYGRMVCEMLGHTEAAGMLAVTENELALLIERLRRVGTSAGPLQVA